MSKKVDSSFDRTVSLGDFDVDRDELEVSLLAHSSVDDCLVCARENEENNTELVAYLVLCGPFSTDTMRGCIAPEIPDLLVPKYVPVSSLPRTRDGRIFNQALVELPVMDSDLVDRWEDQLKDVLDSMHAVVIREPGWELPPCTCPT